MANEILIEAGAFETRVAVMEQGRLVEVHIERRDRPVGVGDIYKGRVSRVVPGIQAAFVDIGLSRDAYLFVGDSHRDDGPTTAEVRQGQELLVQVTKEPLPGKGARISPQLSLAGRYVVLLPGSSGMGISRRIADPDKREEVESDLGSSCPAGCGLIVRTAGGSKPTADLRREVAQLEKTWREIQARGAEVRSPALVYRELGLAMRVARDLVDTETARVWIEGEVTCREVCRWLEQIEPQLTDSVRQHAGNELLFDKFGIDRELSRALRSRLWLRSGGLVVMNPTEALVAIDVNTGRNTEGAELEETARQTNLEAAEEVARQIRLRDLTGIIVVDFIDMALPEHRQELREAFAAALERDRTRTRLSEMSDFGLLAVTRKRMRGGLLQRLTEPCPCCDGEGRVKDPMTILLEASREIRRRAATAPTGRWVVELHPGVKEILESSATELMSTLEEEVVGELILEDNDAVQAGEFNLRAGRESG